MDYLRTLGSAAVSTLVQKSGLNFPFSLGLKVASSDGVWNLYEGTKRDDGSAVSIFEYDCSDRSKTAPLAKNALRKLRTTRHPDVLKFMDAVETDTTIYIMTERVRPLSSILPMWSSKSSQEREDWLLWGLQRISVALAFINDACTSTHGNVRIGSIFISPSGEWKLGSFELFSNPTDTAAVLYTLGSSLRDMSALSPPEVKKGGWSTLKQQNPAAADAYALGLLIHSTFNPTHSLPSTSQPPHPPPHPSSRGLIPVSVFPSFKKLLNPNPKARLSPKSFLDIGMAEDGFFANNPLLKVCLGLDNFPLANELDKNMFLRTLKDSVTSFPSEFASYRVLPSLISALEYGGASAAAILPLVLQFGKNVASEEYPNVILSPLIKLFASPDRGIRMALLERLPEFADKLDKKTVSDKIWPHLQTGFSDTVAVIREATVTSIIFLSSKLTDRVLNNDLLRHLAKMQTDPEPSIRTNTCILIGRLGPSLGYNTKKKVLVPAFSRALKDPFVHARVAGLMALMATIDCYDMEELASRVIANMSFTLIDKEKLVRDQAFKAIELFVKKLEGHATVMPDTVVAENIDASSSIQLNAAPSAVVNSAAGAAGALAGWAISSLGKKLASADMQGSMNSSTVESSVHSLSADAAPAQLLPGSFEEALSSSQTPVPINWSAPLASTNKGMQLRANKGPNLATVVLDAEVAGEPTNLNGPSPWGNDDLIDVNADEDDWSAFESAPTAATRATSPIGLGLGHKNDPALQPNSNIMVQSPKPSNSVDSSAFSRPASLSPPPENNGWDAPETAWGPINVKSLATFPAPSMVGMTKEDKAAEMARRKEERKQRIALLKEQKKTLTKTPP